jgi:uncharacterized membrane protein YdjX (TVP38/TMEM64 family)
MLSASKQVPPRGLALRAVIFYGRRVTDILVEWLRSFGALSFYSGLMVATVFAAAAFVFVPRTFLTVGAGGLYGLSVIPMIIVGATIGSVLTFLIARYFGADRVQRWIDRRPSMRVIADAVDAEGWRIVALLRFASPTPSSVQNYVFGVTRIGFWPYALASLVFTTPPTVLYVYLGSMGRGLLLGDISSPLGALVTLAGVGCLAGTVFLIWRRARASLRQAELRQPVRG